MPQVGSETMPGEKPSLNSDTPPIKASKDVPFPTLSLRGMKIHMVSRSQTVDYLIQCSAEKIGGWVVTPNLDSCGDTREVSPFEISWRLRR
jgi:hypothetical protein